MPVEFLTAYWIKIGATVVIFVGLMALFLRQSLGQRGQLSKGSLQSILDSLGEEYTVVENVIVPGERGVDRVPFVVVSPYGVFVLTVKTVKGSVSGRSGDREWGISGFRKRDTIYNPLWANRKLVNALEAKLGALPFIGVVVFTDARLKGNFGANVIRGVDLKRFCGGYTSEVLTPEQQKMIIEELKQEN